MPPESDNPAVNAWATPRRPGSPHINALLRRAELTDWLEGHPGLTAREIADASGIYDGHRRVDRCLADLKGMESVGYLRRGGRPARWYATSAADRARRSAALVRTGQTEERNG